MRSLGVTKGGCFCYHASVDVSALSDHEAVPDIGLRLQNAALGRSRHARSGRSTGLRAATSEARNLHFIDTVIPASERLRSCRADARLLEKFDGPVSIT
jgi:hypothetical protein